jgi:hypothetical protein
LTVNIDLVMLGMAKALLQRAELWLDCISCSCTRRRRIARSDNQETTLAPLFQLGRNNKWSRTS